VVLLELSPGFFRARCGNHAATFFSQKTFKRRKDVFVVVDDQNLGLVRHGLCLACEEDLSSNVPSVYLRGKAQKCAKTAAMVADEE
jgi:hypothetical protein